MTFSFLTGQQGFTEAVFYCVQSNVNFVAHLDFQFASCVLELLCRNCRFRFQTRINQHDVFVDRDNNATNNGTRTGFDFFQGLFKELSKRFSHIDNLRILQFNVHLTSLSDGVVSHARHRFRGTGLQQFCHRKIIHPVFAGRNQVPAQSPAQSTCWLNPAPEHQRQAPKGR